MGADDDDGNLCSVTLGPDSALARAEVVFGRVSASLLATTGVKGFEEQWTSASHADSDNFRSRAQIAWAALCKAVAEKAQSWLTSDRA